jgi:hypothetical protein
MPVSDGPIKTASRNFDKLAVKSGKEWMRSDIGSLISNRVEPRPQRSLTTFWDDDSIAFK